MVRCLEVSGCDALMLGRGIVADPGLALVLRGEQAPGWDALLPLLDHFWRRTATHVAARHRAGRLKQWLNLLRRRFVQAQAAFDLVRVSNDPAVVEMLLFGAAPSPLPSPPGTGEREFISQALSELRPLPLPLAGEGWGEGLAGADLSRDEALL
jgi:hypothetical protein